MQHKYTRFVLFLTPAMVAVTAALSGCDSTAPATVPETKPFPGVQVRVHAPAGSPVVEVIRRHGPVWAERVGGDVQIVDPNQPADLVMFPPVEMGRLVNQLTPLTLSPDRGQDSYDFSKFLRHHLERNMDWGGAFHAVPVLGEGIVFVFRADLLDDPKHKPAIERLYREQFHRASPANGPATWQEVAVLAEYFVGPGGMKSSLPAAPASNSELDRDFHLMAASIQRRAVNLEKSATLTPTDKSSLYFSYSLDIESGATHIQQPGFVEAVRLMQRLQKCRASGSGERPIDAFARGEAVFAIATLADLHRLQSSINVRDKFGVARIPGSTVVFDHRRQRLVPATDGDGNRMSYHGHGGYLGGVRRDSTQQAASRDFLLFLSSPEVSQEIVCEPAWGGGPTRMNHLDHQIGWHNYGLSAKHTQQLISALDNYYRPTLLNPAHTLRISRQQDYANALAVRLRTSLTGNTPADDVVRSIAADWTKLTESQDKVQVLKEIRNSQGLR